MTETRHHLAAVWFADIARYSDLGYADETAAVRLAAQFQRLAAAEIPRYQGRAVKFLGDGVIAEFPSALGALQAALSLRAAYENAVEERIGRLHPLRFGVHLGEVYGLPDGDLIGHGMNMAARIMAEAGPGEILASDDVRRPVARHPAFAFQHRGRCEMRGVGSMEIFALEPRSGAAPSAHRTAPGRLRWITAAAILVAAIALSDQFVDVRDQVGRMGFHSVSAAAANTATRSLAVLPFRDMTWSDAGRYLGPAVAEGIYERLSVVPGLDVVDPRSTNAFEEGGSTPLEVARELEVDLILDGSVRQTGSRLRVTTRLMDGRSQRTLWATTYEEDATNLSRIQRQIADRVTETLRLEHPASGSDSVPPKPAAHALYLQARYQWNRRNAEGVREAIALFRRTLAEDPGFARAYAGLAKAYVVAPAYAGFSRSDAQSWARAAAETALALDANLGEAHAVLGQIAIQTWEWRAAEREFTRALELSPGDATAHHWYAVYLAARGRSREALSHFDRAEALDPLSLVIVSARGTVYVNAGEWERAIAQHRKALNMDPSFGPAQGNLVEVYELAGRYPEAIEELRSSGLAIKPDADELAAAFAAGGPRGYLGARVRALEADGGPAFILAGLHATMGNREEAFRWLGESYRRHEPEIIELAVHPWFRNLRSDSRFQRLLRDIGLEPPRG